MNKNILIAILNSKLTKLFYITVFLLIALELIARSIWGTDSTRLFHETIPDFIFHHKALPNIVGVDNQRSIPYTLHTNSLSWVEDHDFQVSKPKNTYRIFYVGDSNTVGLVDPPRKMVNIVQTGLQKIYDPLGIRIEVINTGAASYSPLLYYLKIKNEILKFSPDLVVINVDMTDAVNDATYRRTVVNDKEGKPLAVRPTFSGDAKYYRMTPEGTVKISKLVYFREKFSEFLAGHSVLYNKLTKLSPYPPHLVPYQGEDKSANWLALNWTKEIEENVDYSMKILGYSITLLQSHNVRVLITGVPHYPQFTGLWSIKPHAVLQQTAEKYNAPYLNTYEEMKKYIDREKADPSMFYWTTDPTHLNIEGNQLWGEIQLQFLLNNKKELLP